MEGGASSDGGHNERGAASAFRMPAAQSEGHGGAVREHVCPPTPHLLPRHHQRGAGALLTPPTPPERCWCPPPPDVLLPHHQRGGDALLPPPAPPTHPPHHQRCVGALPPPYLLPQHLLRGAGAFLPPTCSPTLPEV